MHAPRSSKIANQTWFDSSGWKLAESLYHVVQDRTHAFVGGEQFISISCGNKVTTCDNQSWINILAYVLSNWEKVSQLVSLERVVDGLNANNLIKVITSAWKHMVAFQEAICI